MKYLCLVYIDETVLDALSEHEFDALIEAALANDDVLRRGGHYVSANALQSVRTATSVRVRDGKVSVTDGPFAETKEHLGGYTLIEAADLTEAIDLAAKLPMARYGTIEVRPIREFKRKDPRG